MCAQSRRSAAPRVYVFASSMSRVVMLVQYSVGFSGALIGWAEGLCSALSSSSKVQQSPIAFAFSCSQSSACAALLVEVSLLGLFLPTCERTVGLRLPLDILLVVHLRKRPPFLSLYKPPLDFKSIQIKSQTEIPWRPTFAFDD